MRNNQPVTGIERQLDPGVTIISHTDATGNITFVNEDFVQASGFDHDELIGQPHNLVRHPDMPAEAFRDLWDTLKHGRPWSGLVKNRCKNGDHYWVRTSVTPKPEGGYMSVRVVPGRDEILAAEALYTRFRNNPGLRLHEGKVVRSGLAGLGDAILARIDDTRIGRRLLAIMVIVMILLVGALADSQRSGRAVEAEYRAHITGDAAQRVAYYKLYAQGLQMGQALRNAMLDPANPKAYDNYARASDAFDVALQAASSHDDAGLKSGLPARIGVLRAEQRTFHERVFGLIKEGQGDSPQQGRNTQVARDPRRAVEGDPAPRRNLADPAGQPQRPVGRGPQAQSGHRHRRRASGHPAGHLAAVTPCPAGSPGRSDDRRRGRRQPDPDHRARRA